MITTIVNIAGLLLIGLIVWWFWFSKLNTITKVEDFVEIKVKDGVYQPAFIQVKANHPVTLRFIREDATPCAEVVVFSSLNISEILTLNKPKDIVLTFKNLGEYEFTCQMGMYKGKIVVN
ncbi:MAG: cupredoxin domain-containing protein [Gammaproteobacteria bacterium]|jgi:plastocyanin domain-containing protein|nr:cupredoxin domain-containing protein [Gammaproteobacteria bacterium]